MIRKFVLMQDPIKWSKVTEAGKKYGYFTIGLKELYPNKGYSSCDEFGITDYFSPYQNEKTYGQFAFLDEESKKQFKGKINYDKEEDIYFATINLAV